MLRDLLREELNGFEEAMGYGMPGYLREYRSPICGGLSHEARTKREATAEASPSQASPRGKHVSLDLRVRRTVAFRRGSPILPGPACLHTHPIAS
jgi:hypothetical protein